MFDFGIFDAYKDNKVWYITFRCDCGKCNHFRCNYIDKDSQQVCERSHFNAEASVWRMPWKQKIEGE